jgi:hypothetical protein
MKTVNLIIPSRYKNVKEKIKNIDIFFLNVVTQKGSSGVWSSTELGLSRTPVREALIELSKSQVVEQLRAAYPKYYKYKK